MPRVNVPEGFEATLFADDDLAHDIYSLTIDAQGRVVVSGPGYVRILIDENGDGRADSYHTYSDLPRTGAQGLYFDGPDLLCSGDQGLLRFTSQDGMQADGPPEILWSVRAGGEHDAHAIRKGPDGWWYVVAGNYAGVSEQDVTSRRSPITRPEAGVVMRISPDFSRRQVYVDGFRNAYDFDFSRDGALLVYDSDGERDVTLPWYRPTRVFDALAGSHAGWFSRGWKRPDHFFDMMPVVADLGRGSPTGVECYRHTQFPTRFHGALFVCDWTFGRIDALLLSRDRDGWKTEPIEFMTGRGQFGFAPTDLAVAPDGSLYVSVGGRGTRGSVYRVRWAAAEAQIPEEVEPRAPALSQREREAVGDDAPGPGEEPDAEPALLACLDAPQPLSSWSRAEWEPAAVELGRAAFVQAALDESQDVDRRVRAVEIVTELFGGFDSCRLRMLLAADDASVRARAAWAAGQSERAGAEAAEVLRDAWNGESDPHMQRAIIEALLLAGLDLPPLDELARPELRPLTRQAIARALASQPRSHLISEARQHIDAAPQLALMFASAPLLRSADFDQAAMEVGWAVFSEHDDARLRRDAVRLMQLAAGDVGPEQPLAEAFDGYASRVTLKDHEPELAELRSALSDAFPTGQAEVDWELARLLGMLQPRDPRLLDKLLDQITPSSHPTHDVHFLVVAGLVEAERTGPQRDRIAEAIVGIESKVAQRELNVDSNWDVRFAEFYSRHVRLDPRLPSSVLDQEAFGRPEHVKLVENLKADELDRAIEVFIDRAEVDDDFSWSAELVFLIGRRPTPQRLERLRQQYSNLAVREAVLLVLAENPSEADRQRLIEGLESPQLNVLRQCLVALEQLSPSQDSRELAMLIRALRRLGREASEYPVRDQVVRLLKEWTGQSFGYQMGSDGRRAQPEAVQRWTDFVAHEHPAGADLLRSARQDIEERLAELEQVDWQRGDPERGARLFEQHSCSRCHGGRRALGPDLAGVARRFSREDLFLSIWDPDRDVSPRYQATMVSTHSGHSYTGVVIYQAVDGVTLRDPLNQTIRIEAEEIAAQQRVATSLMPQGLLDDFDYRDYADLYAYLEQLQ